jgi:hypothetical protein
MHDVVFDRPLVLWLLLLAPLLALRLPRSAVPDRVRNFVALVVRMLAYALVVVAAAGPHVLHGNATSPSSSPSIARRASGGHASRSSRHAPMRCSTTSARS